MSFNVQDQDGDTLLHFLLAVRFGMKKEICREILTYPLDVNIKNKGGYSPLFLALIRNKFIRELFNGLLNKGADLFTRDNEGPSLFYSLINFYNHLKREKAIKWLLENGLDINEKAQDGSTLLHWAAAKALK